MVGRCQKRLYSQSGTSLCVLSIKTHFALALVPIVSHPGSSDPGYNDLATFLSCCCEPNCGFKRGLCFHGSGH